VGPDGNVVSSAQWPARFGYPEPAAANAAQDPFLKREELPDGSTALGLFAVRAIRGSDAQVKLIGGRRLDQGFLADLPVAPGMTAGLYSDAQANTNADGSSAGAVASGFDPARLVGANGPLDGAVHYRNLIAATLKSGTETSGIVDATGRREDSLDATAIPLKNAAGDVTAVLIVVLSRAGMVEAQQHIREIAYGVAAGGILLAIAFSLWIAARFSRPIEQLARAAEEVSGGNWDVRVRERGRDELAVLARSFNRMTAQLTTQRERLV
jgi:two-component system, NtrC family, nitrogen regulation sensor histidine kinase NtrY